MSSSQQQHHNWRELAKQTPRELVLSGAAISKQIADENGINELVFAMSSLNFVEITKTTSLTTLSPKISLLANLTNLVLHSNQLTSLPDEIGSLTKLKYLDVSHNAIASLPNSLSGVSSLQSLNCEFNQLETLPDLSSLVNLLVIKFSGNRLTAFPSSLCDNGALVHLSEIHANKNAIADIPNSVSKLVALKLLDLSANQLQVIPGQLGDCPKLKDVNLKGNKIKDRRLQKLIDQCHAKQIMDYISKNCPRSQNKSTTASSGEQHSNNGTNDDSAAAGDDGEPKKPVSRDSSPDARKSKARETRRRRTSSHSSTHEQDMDTISILNVKEDDWFKVVASPTILEMRKIVVCIVHGVDLTREGLLKRFVTIQTGLHSGICGHRQHATIATHDLSKLTGRQLLFDVRPPSKIKLLPLGRQKEMTAAELYKTLNEEAEAYRKEKKRQTYSGIHKYLYLLKGKQRYPCVMDAANLSVISLPPLTNSENTKMVNETKDLLLEVTGESVPTCRKVMDALLHSMLKMNLSPQSGNNGSSDDTAVPPQLQIDIQTPQQQKMIIVEPVKVVDSEGKLYVQYPSRVDLLFDDVAVKRQKE